MGRRLRAYGSGLRRAIVARMAGGGMSPGDVERCYGVSRATAASWLAAAGDGISEEVLVGSGIGAMPGNEWLGLGDRVAARDVARPIVEVALDEGAFMPERAHGWDAGADLRTPVGFVLDARGSATVDTGVHMAIPRGYAGLLVSKNGINVRLDSTGTGLIDSGYTGSIVVKLYNHGRVTHAFERGDKVIQIVIFQVLLPAFEEVAGLAETERGDGGFGSTGR